MARKEFLAWVAFYELHPFDDFHRHHRPAALIATSLGGGSIGERLDWLAPPVLQPGEFGRADLSTLKAFGLTPPGRT